MDKPDVDGIEGLSPSISIDQKSTSHNPRSTVGTVTEIYDYLRLLFARIGHPHCPICNKEISKQSPQQIVDQILTKISKRTRLIILAPVIRDRKGEFNGLFENLRMKGYRQVRVDGHLFDLDEDFVLIKTNKHTIDVVIDKISMEKIDRLRLMEAIEQAINLTNGIVIVGEIRDDNFEIPNKPKKVIDTLYSEKFSCPVDSISLAEIEPRSFSFNAPQGACPECSGIGSILTVDAERVIQPDLSISEGGILPFSRMFFHDTWFSRVFMTVTKKYGIDSRKPLKLLSEKQKQILLYGTGNTYYHVIGTNRFGKMTTIRETYSGIINVLKRRYNESESDFIRTEIEKYMREEICFSCKGKRLKKEALTVTINDFCIADITDLSILDCLEWIRQLDLSNASEKTISTPIVKEISARLAFLHAVGLDYLTLSRTATTLSGGEAQRIRLASQIGSGLSGVLYVLDEPSIGLHQKDNAALIRTLKILRDLGNTVIVVEHDRETMEEADYIVDFGPGAGEHGGHIIAQGTVENIKNNINSLTGRFLKGERKIQIHRNNTTIKKSDNQIVRKSEYSDNLVLLDAAQNNLKHIDVSFPLGTLICVTGVSGSGKSTLIVETLYRALFSHFNPYTKEKAGSYERIDGLEKIDKVVLIDQTPIGRTPRSNPATYTGVFTIIRDIFTQTHEARLRGYKTGRFSFNVKGGRCEVCEGEGQKKIEMQFLSDVYVTCEACNGRRYNSETLEITHHDKNIAQVLDMSVEEALLFFDQYPNLRDKLQTINDVGLGYIHLGQSAPTLSGGEAQRVKLATELSRRATGKTIYILDEPTTGLHFADLERLLLILHRLTEKGNTVIIIEHNMDIIKNADWVIDLGPEGGNRGGYIVATGKPKDIIRVSSSYTGQILKKIIQ